MTETQLDVKGLGCPIPVLRANRAVKEMIPGDILEILATDRDTPQDFQVFCETTGHKFLDCVDTDGVFTVHIEIT